MTAVCSAVHMTLILTDTGGAVLTLGYRRLRIYKLQEGWLPPTKRASAVKTRMNGLKNHDNTFSRFDTIPVCDRQTDGRTEFG